MPNIRIMVRNKVAEIIGRPMIVCGNSDYIAVFDLDSEWDTYDQKTARFVWKDIRTGEKKHDDRIFGGNTVSIPAVYDTGLLLIGVYAGDIRNTTPVSVECVGCIMDGEPIHSDPDPDVYRHLLDYLKTLDAGGKFNPQPVVLLTNAVPPDIIIPAFIEDFTPFE